MKLPIRFAALVICALVVLQPAAVNASSEGDDWWHQHDNDADSWWWFLWRLFWWLMRGSSNGHGAGWDDNNDGPGHHCGDQPNWSHGPCSPNPCLNGGVCKPTFNKDGHAHTDTTLHHVCICPNGRGGTNCQSTSQTTGSCVGNPCHGGVCTSTGASTFNCSLCPAGTFGAHCSNCSSCPAGQFVAAICNVTKATDTVCKPCSPACGDGFIETVACTDVDRVCTPVNFCQPDPCNGGTCVSGASTYVCGPCPAGKYGSRCDSSCSKTNCNTGTVTCDMQGNNRNCTTGCQWPYTGTACTVAAPCSPAPCNGGVCTASGTTYTCSSCPAGKYGTKCDQSCTQGNCVGTVTCAQSTGASRVCSSCTWPYTGTDCSVADACTPNPCNGGTCVKGATATSFTCSACPGGLTYGATCQTPCPQGNCVGAVTCSITGGSRVCSACNADYFGADCTTPSPCAASPCNGGVCAATSGTAYTCSSCPAGRTGTKCEQTCTQGNCVGSVTCAQTGPNNARVCVACTSAFVGTNCTIANPCATASGPCNGGVCTPSATGTYTCSSCPAGKYGTNCESSCTQGHCTGTVTCAQSGGGSRQCTTCTPPWKGSDCETFEPCSPNPCNGGTCQTVGTSTGFVCASCPAGKFGVTCEQTCAQGNCVGAVTCATDGSGRVCSACTWPYINAAAGCVDVDPCQPDPCNGGHCTASGLTYTCDSCPAGTWGTQCQKTCDQGNCATSGTITCAQDGTNRVCSACVKPYSSTDCSVLDLCSMDPCHGGACQSTGTDFVCTSCLPGAWGTTCSSACAQGHCASTVTCQQQSGNYRTCNPCVSGYSGPDCEHYDPCSTGDLCHGGVCVNGANEAAGWSCSSCPAGQYGAADCSSTCDQGQCVGAVTCALDGSARQCQSCNPGWSGSDCSAFDPCFTTPCNGGRCTEAANSTYTCDSCPAGSYGTHCELACAQGNCFGTVTCAQDGTARTCSQCMPGFIGGDCTAFDVCAAKPCNGGTCINGANTFTCVNCPAGTWGDVCATPCDQGHCAGTVTCDQATGANRACGSCVAPYFGSDCSGDPCVPNPCNNGVCAIANGALTCTDCPAGFWGSKCENTCAQGHCVGTVSCDQATGANRLCSSCVAPYVGTDCSRDPCSPNPCNGGTCSAGTCSNCPAGTYGPTCSSTCAQGNCIGTVTCDANGATRVCSACQPHYSGTDCTIYSAACPAGFLGTKCDVPCAGGSDVSFCGTTPCSGRGSCQCTTLDDPWSTTDLTCCTCSCNAISATVKYGGQQCECAGTGVHFPGSSNHFEVTIDPNSPANTIFDASDSTVVNAFTWEQWVRINMTGVATPVNGVWPPVEVPYSGTTTTVAQKYGCKRGVTACTRAASNVENWSIQIGPDPFLTNPGTTPDAFKIIYSSGGRTGVVSVPLGSKAGDQWFHLAMTYSSTGGDLGIANITFYINGAPHGDSIIASVKGFSANQNAGNLLLNIQRTSLTAMTVYESCWDEVRAWNLVRSADQIKSNMLTPVADADKANLKLYLKLDETSGVVTDYSQYAWPLPLPNIYPSIAYRILSPHFSAATCPSMQFILDAQGATVDRGESSDSTSNPITTSTLSMIVVGAAVVAGIIIVAAVIRNKRAKAAQAHRATAMSMGMDDMYKPHGMVTIHARDEASSDGGEIVHGDLQGFETNPAHTAVAPVASFIPPPPAAAPVDDDAVPVTAAMGGAEFVANPMYNPTN